MSRAAQAWTHPHHPLPSVLNQIHKIIHIFIQLLLFFFWFQKKKLYLFCFYEPKAEDHDYK